MPFMLTYVSRLSDRVDRSDVQDIVGSSQTRNASVDVTGLLLIRGRRVMQVLEGDEHDVRQLFDRIRADERHSGVTPVWLSEPRERRFPNWSMGFEDLDGRSVGQAESALVGSGAESALTATSTEQRQFLSHRQDLLRRSLIDEDRLVSTLAVIMYAHDAEEVCADDGAAHIQCRECPPVVDPLSTPYPCPTAQNAFWALDAAVAKSGPRLGADPLFA